MKRNLIFLFIFSLCYAAIGCNDKQEQTPEPEFERVIPPEADAPAGGQGASEFMEEPEDAPGFTEYVEETPDDIFIMFDRLNSLHREGRIEEALETARELGAVEENNPFRAVAYLKLARIILDDLPADSGNRAELVEEGIEGLLIAISLEPANIPAHEAFGKLSFEAGDNDTALHHLAIALTVKEIGYELRIRMAEVYIEREDFDKAQAHLEAAKPLAEEAEDNDAVRQINGLMSEIG